MWKAEEIIEIEIQEAEESLLERETTRIVSKCSYQPDICKSS